MPLCVSTQNFKEYLELLNDKQYRELKEYGKSKVRIMDDNEQVKDLVEITFPEKDDFPKDMQDLVSYCQCCIKKR